MAQPGKWERVRTDAGWHLRLKGANGEIVVTSETYNDARQVAEALGLIVRTASSVMFSTEGPGITDVDERTQS